MDKKIFDFVNYLNDEFQINATLKKRIRKNGFNILCCMFPSSVVVKIVAFCKLNSYGFYISEDDGLVSFAIYKNNL